MRGIRRMVRLSIAYATALAAALQFLTRLPLPVKTANFPAVFPRSTVFYPAAGLVIGTIVAAAAYGVSFVFPANVTAVLVLGVWVLLSGGLHLDGLMDTADGLLSHRSRERMLEIMKDSRVGAMGVIVCVLYLLLKFALLSGLMTGVFDPIGQSGGSAIVGDDFQSTGDTLGEYILLLALLPVWSRSFLPAAIACWPYARQESGVGQLFRAVRGKHALASLTLAAGLTLLVLQGSGLFDWLASAWWCLSLAAATYLVGGICAALASRKLGGLTGDVYGALNELLELVLLLALVGYLQLVY